MQSDEDDSGNEAAVEETEIVQAGCADADCDVRT